MTPSNFWFQFLAQLGGPIVVTILVTKWLLNRAERELDRRLETRQTANLEEIRKQHQIELQSLQAVEARLTSQFGVVTALESAAHTASLSKRVDAVDHLWRAVVFLAQKFPAGIALLDMVAASDYSAARTHENTRLALQGMTRTTIATDYLSAPEASADQLRPFLSNLLWQYYFAYRAFLARICATALDADTSLTPWYQDTVTCRLLRSVVSEDEFDQIMNLTTGKLRAARNALESHILSEIRRVLSGELDSARAVERVREIGNAIAASQVESVR